MIVRWKLGVLRFQGADYLEPRSPAVEPDPGAVPPWSKAAAAARRLGLEPVLASLQGSAGLALAHACRDAEAVPHFERALALRPHNLELRHNLAWLLASSPDPSVRDGSRAVDLLEPAMRVGGGATPRILDTLAAAHAACGRFQTASDYARQAEAEARRRLQWGLAEEAARRRTRYQSGEAFFRSCDEGTDR
jgi:predicted Zn-dependent protease